MGGARARRARLSARGSLADCPDPGRIRSESRVAARALQSGEAAGVRDEAEVIRLIEQGHDPNASYVIRPSLMFSHPTRLTPLEVAAARDDPAILRQLLAKGATMDAALWTRLRCMEASPSVSEVLDEYRPDAAPSGCDGVNLTSHP